MLIRHFSFVIRYSLFACPAQSGAVPAAFLPKVGSVRAKARSGGAQSESTGLSVIWVGINNKCFRDENTVICLPPVKYAP